MPNKYPIPDPNWKIVQYPIRTRFVFKITGIAVILWEFVLKRIFAHKSQSYLSLDPADNFCGENFCHVGKFWIECKKNTFTHNQCVIQIFLYDLCCFVPIYAVLLLNLFDRNFKKQTNCPINIKELVQYLTFPMFQCYIGRMN